MVALFAYVATSAFILESMNGLSPLAYSVAFAANAGGMTGTALLAARLAGRVATRRVIRAGQVLALAAGPAMLAGALWLGTARNPDAPTAATRATRPASSHWERGVMPDILFSMARGE